jgi:hypothetical protein
MTEYKAGDIIIARYKNKYILTEIMYIDKYAVIKPPYVGVSIFHIYYNYDLHCLTMIVHMDEIRNATEHEQFLYYLNDVMIFDTDPEEIG